MQRTERHQLARGLIHEDAAAMYRRAYGIGRDKQDAELFRCLIRRCEAIAKIASQRPAKRFRVADGGKLAGARTCADRIR